MKQWQIVAVRLQPQESRSVSRIFEVQVAEGGSAVGYVLVETVIEHILKRLVHYYTHVGNSKADVEVVNAHPKFIRTVGDGTISDNLLQLPRY